ncbi:putative sporulation protein (polysaccharide deacetylase family) [Tumebacillus sp. BK434]|nr:putative sporulation protein (polysaccharide deacetylase family) [Tumebacillus sp. BK434]
MKRPYLIVTLTKRRLLLCAAAFLFLAGGLVLSGSHEQQVAVVNVMTGVSHDSLKQRIELLAKEYDKQPIDAKNDPVWRAIPGLNGLKVDVDATYEKTKKAGGDRIQVVAEQIPPKVHLKDLGAVPIYKANAQKKQIALMINVAWGTEYIPEMLATLAEHQVKATFFLDGSWTKKNPDVAKQIAAAGHELGNHAYSHPDMSRMGVSDQLRQITRTNEVIEAATGIRPKLFAPPSGAYADSTVSTAYKQGMYTILWSLDTVDWKKPPAATIVNRVLSRAENGSMVLMHPTEPTRNALRTIVPSLVKKGYGLVTVSELLDETRPVPSS